MTFGKALLLAATAGVLACPATAQTPATPSPATLQVPPIRYTERTLANGLRVLALRDTTTPNVAVSIWYEVGSKHDPEGRSGFAHMFEHILSRKTRNIPFNGISQMTEDVGGQRNASTWYDRTNYYEIVPAQYLETMLWTHAERMARPVVDAEVFETERNVVKEELRERVLAPPYGRLFSFVLGENGFDALPHRRPTIGSIADLEAATLADARAFHEAYYGPDTATLIVSGNFDEARLQSLIDRHFSAIPRRPNPVPLAIATAEPPRAAPRAVVARAPNVPLPAVAKSYKIPGAAHPDMAALEVLDGVLTTGQNARLYKALVRSGLAVQALGRLDSAEEAGFYAAGAIVGGGKTPEQVEPVLAAELERVRAEPVTAAELIEAKNELISSALGERETFSGRAFELGEALVRTGDPKHADKRLAAIGRVTAADVQRVARLYLDPQKRLDIRYVNDAGGQGGEASWANPYPRPRYGSVPPARRAPIELAAEGARQAPPAPGQAPRVTTPTLAESRLPTGLRVVAVQTGPVPLAALTVVIPGGASTDPRAKAGLATLAASLATKGTTTRSADAIAAEMERLGANLSANAGPDGTTLFVSAPAANLEAAGRVLADIVRNATFPADELERERKRALDNLTVRLKDPGGLASMVAQPVLYGAAPYGTLPGGTVGSLPAISREDLAAHQRRWWHPGNAAVIVTGGIAPAEATRLAGALFADWRGTGPAPAVPKSRAGEAAPVRTVVVDLPAAGQAAVLAAVRGIDRSDRDYYNLVVANAVLGQGASGRLFQEVRVKRALSYGASSGHPARADDSVLTASAQTKNESAADVAKVFLDEFDRLGREAFEPDAVAKRKLFIQGYTGQQMETSVGYASMLAGLVQQGVPAQEATRFLSAIDRVDAPAASRAAARLVSGDRATIVIVGDASKFIDKLRALRPDVEVIPAAELDLDAPTLRRTASAAGAAGAGTPTSR